MPSNNRCQQQFHPFFGFLLIALAGFVCFLGANWPPLQKLGISALSLSILIGMIYGNTIGAAHDKWTAPAIKLARTQALRLGIALYGVRLTFFELQALGLAGILIPLGVLIFIFVCGGWIGQRCFGLSRAQALLISTGSAVCGAAAVLAMAPVARGSDRDVAVAVATVVLFGTLGMFFYPVLFSLVSQFADVSIEFYGVFIGSTLHEVAQVVAAAKSTGDASMSFAVLSKMVRVIALAPVLLIAAVYYADFSSGGDPRPNQASQLHQASVMAWRAVPWFAMGLLVVIAINSMGWIPARLIPVLIDLDTWLLSCAMFAIGAHTRIRLLLDAGARPLWFAASLFALLMVGGALINVGFRLFF